MQAEYQSPHPQDKKSQLLLYQSPTAF